MIDMKEISPSMKSCDTSCGLVKTRKFSIPAIPEVASAVRFSAARVARDMGFGKEQIGDIELSVGEAISNAIKYGCRRDIPSRIMVRFHRYTDRFVAEISDCGYGFDPLCLNCPDEGRLIEGGRGIHFMNSFMDEVIFSFGEGTTVYMTKLLR